MVLLEEAESANENVVGRRAKWEWERENKEVELKGLEFGQGIALQALSRPTGIVSPKCRESESIATSIFASVHPLTIPRTSIVCGCFEGLLIRKQ